MTKILVAIMVALATASTGNSVEVPYDPQIVDTVEMEEVSKEEPLVMEVTPPVETETVDTTEPLYDGFQRDAELLAKTLWGEARGIDSDMEKAAVCWCVLNRVDDERFPNTVEEVVSQPYQFLGFSYDYPVWEDLLAVAEDVLTRWYTGGEGRVLPNDYFFFRGDGEHNHFRKEFNDTKLWDWSLENPYE